MKGNLIVVSGPSGVGKGSLCSYAIEKTGAVFSISATTRAPREGEIDGKDYFFLTEEQFKENIKNEKFVEYVFNYGRSYGTLRSEVDSKLKSGYDIIFDIDVAGGKSIKEKYPDATLVFVLPPELSTLQERLSIRGTETEEQKAVRLEGAMHEIEALPFYDYCIVNDNLDQARQGLIDIIKDKQSDSDVANKLKLKQTEAEKTVERFKEEKNALSGN